MNNTNIVGLINNSVRNQIYWNGNFDVETILKQSNFKKEQEEKVKSYIQNLKNSYEDCLKTHEKTSLYASDGKTFSFTSGLIIGTLIGYVFDSPGMGGTIGGTICLMGEFIKKPIGNFIKKIELNEVNQRYFKLMLDSPKDADRLIGIYEN